MVSACVIEACFYIIQCSKKNCSSYTLITIFVSELRQSEEVINLSKIKIIGDIKIIITNTESENIDIPFNQIMALHMQYKAKYLIKLI